VLANGVSITVNFETAPGDV